MHRHWNLVPLFFFLILFSPRLFAEEPLLLDAQKVKDLALSNSLEIQIASLDQEIAGQNLPAAKSIYDTILAGRVNYLQDKSDRNTTVFGTDNSTLNYDLRVEQRTPFGTQFGFGFLNQRDTTDSIFAIDELAYNSKIEMTFRQPVARNSFGFVDRKRIEVVKKRLEAVDAVTRFRAEVAVFNAMVDYWQFYGSFHNVTLEQESKQTAEKLYRDNAQKKEMGLIEPPDLYAFAANQNLRENEWLLAKNALVARTELLRRDLSLSPALPLAPEKDKVEQTQPISLDQALIEALTNRSDYLALKKEIEAADLQVALAKNTLWPQVDVVASLTLNGLNDDYGQALEDIGEGHPIWLVGMEMNVPIQNRLSESEYEKSKIEKTRKIVELKQKEEEIIQQITEKTISVGNAATRLGVTKLARENTYRKFVGELNKYEQGRSDTDIVIRYQVDYIRAKQLELLTRVDYEVSRIELDFAMGRMIQSPDTPSPETLVAPQE